MCSKQISKWHWVTYKQTRQHTNPLSTITERNMNKNSGILSMLLIIETLWFVRSWAKGNQIPRKEENQFTTFYDVTDVTFIWRHRFHPTLWHHRFRPVLLLTGQVVTEAFKKSLMKQQVTKPTIHSVHTMEMSPLIKYFLFDGHTVVI